MFKSISTGYLFLIILALGLFSTQVYRPIDGTSRSIWRECDLGSIARNFYEQDMNIFYPRIDWGGAGPGYVESEFPFGAWITAVLYKIFGYHIWFFRLVSMMTMLGSCGVFFLLAKSLLSEKTALLASLIFVLHPYIFLLSTAIQPEPIMFLGYLSAIYAFLQWMKSDKQYYYWIALIATTISILAKVTAAHIGILFALLSFDKFGIRALSSIKLWFFAFLSLGIPFLWYQHARSIWEIYGNSLGLSNEGFARIGHFQLNEFWEVRIKGNLYTEIVKVWVGFGSILGIAGFYSFYNKKQVKFFLYWVISLAFFYLIAGETTGESWAAYYHLASVPLACIAIAEGVSFLNHQLNHAKWLRFAINAMLLVIISVECGVIIYFNFIVKPKYEDQFLSSNRFKELIPNDSLIIANGPSKQDSKGRKVAANPSYYFFWLNKKGFTLHENMQTMEYLDEFKKMGAQYFIVDRSYIHSNPAFYEEVFAKYSIIDETKTTILVDLTQTLKEN